MSEKEKMQTEELAKIMDDAKPLGKSALSFMAGFVQGYKEAQSADPAENTGRKEGKRAMRFTTMCSSRTLSCSHSPAAVKCCRILTVLFYSDDKAPQEHDEVKVLS